MVSQLVERIRQKDQRAMRQFYQQYVEELSSVCYRYVPSNEDAKDVLQNSFVKIFTLIPTMEYRGEEPFRSWIKRVVANEALCYLKQQKMLKFVEQDVADLELSDDEEPQSERLSPDELHRLISELPHSYRTVLNLFVFEGYSHRQIGELLGISDSTSASQYYHAKKLLAKKIKDLTKNKR